MPEWARFQKWVAKEFCKIGFTAKSLGQAHGGHGVPDVDCPPFHIECKSYSSAKPDIYAAVMQAKVDACCSPEKYPIAITKFEGDRKPLVSMLFDDFLNLMKEWKDGKPI